MRLFKIKFSEIDRLSVFLCLIWGHGLLGYANAVFLRLPVLKEVGEYATEIILVIALLICIRSISKYVTFGCVSFYFAWLIAFLLTYVFFPLNTAYLDENIAPFFLATLPLIFAGRAINVEKISKPFYVISIVYILWRFIIIFFLRRDEREMGEFSDYNMAAAYALLPHLLMVTWYLLKKINFIDVVVCLIGAILLLGFGTRGPVFCTIVFVGLYYLFAQSYKNRWLSTFIIIGVASLTIIFVDFAFDILGSTTSSLGLSNRIFFQYEEGMLNSDSGRSNIQNRILAAINEGGFFGLGICGDRAATRENYSHNLFVELISSFGYSIGIVLITSLLLFFYVTWRKCKTQDQKGFFLVLLSFNVHLLLSSSFLQTPLFFFFIGYCARIISEKKSISNALYEKFKFA